MKKTETAKFPPLLIDRTIPWRKEHSELQTLIDLHTKAIVDKIEAEFKANGGCETCRGRGWIVTWDTMDSMSGCYAEYGKCTNEACTEITRAKSGRHPTYTKYDGLQGVQPILENHPAYAFLVKPLQERCRKLQHMIDDVVSRCTPKRDDIVVVTKGRKVPIGFTGKIFWSRPGEWGTRIGIKHPVGMGHDEKVVWTYLDNVSIIDTETCKEKGIDWVSKW